MAEYILFSPLGMSDPTRGCRDGGFIHISRFYKPGKAYLYMSSEICKFDEQDNRYEKYLNMLCKKLNFKCEVVKIKRPDLVNVNDFDVFYEDFTAIIERISNENPDVKILINLSSGTPQMKSALKVVSSLSSRRLVPVQVSTPVCKSNRELPVGADYDIELEWELNDDNIEENPKNRCTPVKSENFNALIKHEIITKHIEVYDYKAALRVAETIKDFMDPKRIILIQAGERRLALDTRKAEMLARSVSYDLLPVKNYKGSEKGKIDFEYILNLKIKLEKGELADFARAVSPVLTDIFELYLENKCGINIQNCYVLNGSRGMETYKLSRSLLPDDLLQVLDNVYSNNGGYIDTEPCAANLSPLVIAKALEMGDLKAAQIAEDLRKFEKNVRNIAAHQIVTVTEKWIKERTGFNLAEVFRMLQDFISICIQIPKDAWDSYDKLNEAIINSFKLK